MVIAHTLKKAREDAGLTIRELARIIDAGEAQVSRWETGKATPRADVLARYAAAGLIRVTIGEGAA